MHDDSNVWLTFWAKAKSEAPDAQAARYEAEVAPTLPGYWDYIVATSDSKAAAEERVAKQVSVFAELEPKYRAVATRAPKDLDVALGAMRQKFPDFDPKVEIRLLHGLGNMDGGTRVMRGQYYLLFGLDVMARLHTWNDDRAFFAHELFHTYNDQKLGRDGRSAHLVESIEEETHALSHPLYEALWNEGLATYVSEWAVPGASHASMLLTIPEDLEPVCHANLDWLVADLTAKLDSTSPVDYAAYFQLKKSDDPRRPRRARYCVGYLVAKKLHETVPMTKLVSLEGAELRARIAATLPLLRN